MSAAPPLDRGTARLTWLYIVALSAVALLSISGQFLVQRALRQQTSDSTIVNIAGRQRMLSQKLTKEALASKQASTPTERARWHQAMRGTLQLWQQSHQGLQQGDPELHLPAGSNSPVIAAQFARLQPIFDDMVTAAESLLKTSEPAQQTQPLNRLLQREPEFLAAMDAVVFQFDREARARVTRLQRIEWFLLGSTILVLACEGWLVFRPAVEQIRRAGRELFESRRQLQIAKEAAESANEQKTRFLANISHELRNPLHAILGNAELALSMVQSRDQQQFIETIVDSGNSLRALVDELLDLACLQEGKLRVHPAPFDLRALAERCLAMLRPTADRQQLQLTAELPASPLVVLGDSLRVQQIMLNLLGNALKFTRQGSVRLCITQSDDRSAVRIEVSDTGPGIPPELQQTIFDAFTQGDTRSDREHAGVGLGLAICQGLIELMNGRIRCESELGVGSRFIVDLPLAAVTLSAPVAKVEAIKETSSVARRILVAEDDPVNRKLIADFLRTLGHDTRIAADGHEALALHQAAPFDLGLLDWNMPQLDGLELARRIRQRERGEHLPRVPLIAISAAGIVADNQQAQEAGIDLVLSKPVGLDQLRAVLESFLHIPSLDSTDVPATSAPALDDRWSQPLARMQGKRELFRDVARTFLDQLPAQIRKLTDEADRHDFRELARTAHLLCGQLATFDATDLIAAAEQLEAAADAHDASRCRDLATQIAGGTAELQHSLQQAIAQL
ncbi:Autoinducer 2 sensor kinase/phosphatase LuxQ [Anatilimnocola aggregata]|uniref:histidine kinase n=1 Tax=Anatilimnocola aggregata TaxID=2528021 RepID=A0A517Y693_9BACT|nr:ATP-binding protein [Anatilimnocola aggregata]QDU25751.1 Autoinducer 2 sensor kinase/phosphatase LuxQ [Anatilimnocola aggregata]